MDAFKKRGREKMGIKRPVKVDGDLIADSTGRDILCSEVALDDVGTREVAACINLAPKLAEALRESIEEPGCPMESTLFDRIRTLLTEWDTATSQCDPS